MKAFVNKAKIDTNAILRYDALNAFFRKLDERVQIEYHKRLETSGYTEENVSLSLEAVEVVEQLKKLDAEKLAMNGDMSFQD